MSKFLFFILFILGAFNIGAQSVGNGSLGNATLSFTYHTDETRARVVEIDPSNSAYDEIELDPSNTFQSPSFLFSKIDPNTNQQNRVLIMNMAQGQSPLPTRNYQIALIQAVFTSPPPPFGTGAIILRVNKFTKTNWCLTVGADCKLQVILVPQFNNLTLNNGAEVTCYPWDGNTGGVSCFLVQNKLTINAGAWINVAQKGFRNLNSGGNGGNGGGNPFSTFIPQNPATFPIEGNNGLQIGPEFRPLRQPSGDCNLTSQNGGKGGTGGYAYLGGNGFQGFLPETRMNHSPIAPPNLVFLGNAGLQGNGGRGGKGGGQGGNGGNGGDPAYPGQVGFSGNLGSDGGQGGNGGKGGGAIIVLANEIIVNTGSPVVNISAENGNNALPINSAPNYGESGSGGMGGDAKCHNGNELIGYGPGGIRGQRGDGASGGQGGSGGNVGSASIRFGTTGNFSKSLHVKRDIGLKGTGMTGEPIPNLTSSDGADGFPVNCAVNVCDKNTYTVYDCACNEAYRVLAEMDEATEYPNYIEYQNTGKFINSYLDKKNNVPITVNFGSKGIQYCYYYKNSQLLIAFERIDDVPVTEFRNDRLGSPVAVFNKYRYHVFWCKLSSIDMVNCNTIHSDAGVNINNYTSPFFITPNISLLASTLKTTLYHTLTYDYGWVEFNGIGFATNKYRYEDHLPYVAEQGRVFEMANPGNECRKGCLPFEMEWVYPIGYLQGNSGNGGGGGGGGSSEYPVLPYMQEIWDVPVAGDTGPDGQDGEGGDENSDDGSFPPGGGDDEGSFTTLETIKPQVKQLTLYPNPSKNLVYLLCENSEMLNGNIEVLDVKGKVIQRFDAATINGFAIDLKDFASGIYFVKVQSNLGIQSMKLIKE